MSGEVWIIIPTFRRAALLMECLDSLSRQTYARVNVVVVIDGWEPDTRREVGKRFPDTVVLQGDGNCWWSGSINLGLAWVLANAGSSDYVVTFNDDVVVTPDYVDSIVAASRAYGDLALVGSMCVDIDNPQKVLFVGTRLDWRRAKWGPDSVPQADEFGCVRSDTLPGRGTLIPVAAFRKTGFFDAGTFPQYFGDEDYSLKARAAGYQLVVSRKAVVLSHFRATGIGRIKPTLSEFGRSLFSVRSPNQLARRVRFAARWCPAILFPSFAAIDVAKVVSAPIRQMLKR